MTESPKPSMEEMIEWLEKQLLTYRRKDKRRSMFIAIRDHLREQENMFQEGVRFGKMGLP